MRRTFKQTWPIFPCATKQIHTIFFASLTPKICIKWWFIKSYCRGGLGGIQGAQTSKSNFHLCMKNFAKQIKMHHCPSAVMESFCLEIIWSEYFPTFCKMPERKQETAERWNHHNCNDVSIIIPFGALSNYTIHLNLQPRTIDLMIGDDHSMWPSFRVN